MECLERAKYTYDDYKKGALMLKYDLSHKQIQPKRKFKRRKKLQIWTRMISNHVYSEKCKQRSNGIKKDKKIKEYKACSTTHRRFIIHSKLKLLGHTETQQIDKHHAFLGKSSYGDQISDGSTPIYLHKSHDQPQLIFVMLTDFDSVMKTIWQTLQIPKNKVNVMFYGKLLRPEILHRVNAYDSLNILIKGKGGMKGEAVTISKNSTEETVREWLKVEIGLTETDFEQFPAFKYLDGQTLLDYEDVNELANDLKIPIGLSRRIFLLRHESENLKNLLKYEMSKWSVSDVQVFIRKSVNVISRDVDQICDIVKEKYIDGLVFLSYKSSKEMQADLQREDTFGIIFKKIITKRDEENQIRAILLSDIYKSDNSIDTASITNMPIQSTGSVGNNSESNDTKLSVNPMNQEVSEKWTSYLETVLHLSPRPFTENNVNTKHCKLSIIHADWKNRNMLEKKLLFFILSDVEEFVDDTSMRSLWDRIRKHMSTWHEHFSEVDKKLFEVSSQKDDVLISNKKNFALSKGTVKLRFLMEKNLKELIPANNVFLLISKTALQMNSEGYFSFIEHPRKKSALKIFFSFVRGRQYWFFDPSDYSFGFKLQSIPAHSFGDNEMSDKIDNEVLSMSGDADEAKKVINKTDGDESGNKSTLNEKNPQKNMNNLVNQPSIHNIQKPRSFKGCASDIQYIEGYRISTSEHDGSVSFQCYEFKFVPDRLLDKEIYEVSIFMGKEIIRFACGCLNARKNGTIMFGIGDSCVTLDHNFVHGEVVGVTVDAIKGDFRAYFTDFLRTNIGKCFENHCCATVLKCIGNPVFVKVSTKLPCSPKFVIEVDIEPATAYCKNDFFKINRSSICRSKDVENMFTLYVREKTGTVKKTKIEENIFIKTELREIILKREQDEKQMLNLGIGGSIESPMDMLRRLVCKGSNKIDKSIWPILVLSKPTDLQKENDKWLRTLKFIKLVNFHAVFDFDDESNKNGICSVFRNEENSILHDEQIFLELSGNKLDLATKLGMPHDMKTVWIFSNGRADIVPEKPAKSGEKWTNTYSAGIRDAVIFFSQKEIIPKGRALVILLLFSTNFDGLVETYREIDIRFGSEQTVIIATEDALTSFICECKDKEETIKSCSISGKGMTWEHVNSTFLEITGCEDQGNIFLTTSTGAYVAADEKFVETLTEFHILSARQCESKTFKTRKEEDEFSSAMELQFYKGEKVDWFNFHFGTHVLERHCFQRLKSSVSNILQNTAPVNDRDKRIVSTVIIAHEPGAGGTTLSRHILWTFHKVYRCAIITKITERTAKNVLALWQHKESKNAKPLLLLIDELAQSDLTFEDLIRQIHVEFRSNPVQESLICCFLICQREHEISDQTHYANSVVTHSGHLVEHLKQKLTETEIKWMDNKYEKLEEKGVEYLPEYLLSFMILRQGFSQEYIKNTIKQFLSTIDIASNEFELLSYTSLVSTYAPTSRRGPKVFIPLECCDDLMGKRVRKSAFWEKTMSSTLKMFLIVEEKETASGMQIRMAHPALADAVLTQILERNKESLSSLTERFLDCAILQSTSHGREMIVYFTKEMLVRRLKEEYNDDRTTSYSPLIEDICRKEAKWENAKNVLQVGFEKIKDNYIAQTLARLCSKHEDFDDAISWAKQAVEMSIGNKTANGFCHHTLGIVLDELFNHETRGKLIFTPCEATNHIAVILSALDHFMEACRLRTGTADHILYPVQSVLKTIVNCLKFIRTKVEFKTNVDILKFITDETYLHEEIEDWKKFKPKFLSFSIEGEKAFTVIEQCLCFNTTFYAHEGMSSFPTREHRLYRVLQYNYPDLFNDFKTFFGAAEDDPPQSHMPEVLNNWHRRCLLSLGGNSYMNICNMLRRIKSKRIVFNVPDAIKKCVEIKSHLIKITDRTPRDLSNLVSVNIVLGLLGGEKRDSPQTILEYCKQIIKFKRDHEDIAYFFICLLLWPSSEINVDYDDDLFYESLRFLHRKKESKQVRQRECTFIFLKEEKNVTQPTTQFFLTNGRGFKSYCHRFDLFFRGQDESQFDNAMWDNCGVTYNLKRLKGHLKFCEGRSSIRLLNEKSTSSPCIEIRKIRTGKKEFLSEEEVYFYLGFSIAGPIAYNVKPTRHEDRTYQLSNNRQLEDAVEQFLEETEENLYSKLRNIEDLKSKMKNGRKLKTREMELLKHEDDIKTALEVKRNDLYSTYE